MSKIKETDGKDKKELYKFLMEYFPGISVNFASHIEDAVIQAVDSVMSYPGETSTATAVMKLRGVFGEYKKDIEQTTTYCPHDITFCEYCFLKETCTLTPKELPSPSVAENVTPSKEKSSIYCTKDISFCGQCYFNKKCTLIPKEKAFCPTTINFSGGCDGSCVETGRTCSCKEESPKWNEIKSTEDSRGSILKEAYNIINGERQDQYGNPEDSFGTIAKLWSVYMDSTITGRKHLNVPSVQSKDVALMMTLLKIAREMHTHKRDNLVDAAGYISLANIL